jgi:hypothetical protein
MSAIVTICMLLNACWLYPLFYAPARQGLTKQEWIFYTLRCIITPSCWMRIYRASSQWSVELNDMLNNNPKFEEFESYYAIKLNGQSIWIANYPYACCNKSIETLIIPSRKVVFKFFDIMNDEKLNTIKNGMPKH